MHVNCSGPSTGDALDLFQVGRTYRIEVALTNIGRDDFWSCYLGTHWKRIEPPASLMPTNSESGGVAPLICRVESYLSRIPRTLGIDRDPIRHYSPEMIWDPSWDAEAKDVAAGDHALFLECKAILAGLKGVELRILSPPAYAGRCLSLHHSCRVTTNVLAMFPWQEDLEVIAPTNEIGRADFLLGTHAVTVRRLSGTGSAKQPSEQSGPTP
jgi:hypothetical protein